MKRYTLLIIIALTSLMSHAQITIGGDVYGGGNNGAVNVDNIDAASEDDKADVISSTDKTAVKLTSSTSDATSITLTKGVEVRTVFGGGRNGRCYGQTNVTMDDGTVGAEKWDGTIHGGIFGAGDGSSAWVFGKENKILIKGGTIYNNVYGGGNQADLMGCTNVTLQDGTYYGSVFGGARMANIYGHSFVNLDGKNVPTGTTLIVPTVYGGNDISGTIAHSDNWDWTKAANIDISNIPITANNSTYASALGTPINSTWNAFVASTYKDAATNNIFVGNLYGGGNGDYTYSNGSVKLVDQPAVAEVKYTAEDAEVIAGTKNVGDVKTAAVEQTTKTFTDLSKPTIGKDYLNLQGGTFGYVYGGGNNATVTESVDILVWDAHFNFTTYEPYMATIPKNRISDTGMLESMFTIDGDNATPNYQIDRIFGGNNKAEMSIQPHWYLAQGTFNNIYSGGNQGDMTCSTGILLNIGSRSVFANNVYGGCRMADVRPKDASGNTLKTVAAQELTALKVQYTTAGAFASLDKSSYTFEKDYPARVYITEGHINNVYGGNDISGRVYLGSNVAIAGAISGNVFGGGNGSYAYTDNATLGNDPEYADLYYDGGENAETSIAALNAKRPHVDNTLLHIWGDENQQPSINETTGVITALKADGTASTEQPVIVTGGVYCGGNSAAIESTNDLSSTATFKIGKNVIINSVFMGSNGENMITSDILAKHASTIDGNKYSSFSLTDKETFASYMDGCAVNILPTIKFDWNEGDDPHTYIGSFYGGGNVGSQKYASPITLTMPEGLIIYDQVVGGCNQADVKASTYNAAFEGGVITANSGSDATQPKVTLNMNSYLEPRQLTPSFNGKFLSSAKLYWDVRKYYQIGDNGIAVSVFKDDDGNAVSVPFILYGANVFGGCYTSGHINGDVTINISHDLISPNIMKNPTYSTSQNFYNMGGYVFAKTMTVYGGGFGENTSIWGNTNVNLSDKARVISVMGGADLGIIGTKKQGFHNAKMGNTIVTCSSNLYDYSKSTAYEGMDKNMPYNAIQVYGGAFAGTIYGHTELRLNGGSFRNVFGGSCKADIADYASLYIGAHDGSGAGKGFPYIKGNAYGGNDFGGYIGYDGTGKTTDNKLVDNTADGFTDAGGEINGYWDYYDTQIGYNKQSVRSPRYVEYNSGRIEGDIYGGSCGSYDYKHKFVQWNYLADGKEITATQADASCTNVEYDFDPNDYTSGKVFPYPLAKENIPTENAEIVTNCYVNVRSTSTDKVNDIIKNGILGGGRGIMEQTGIVDAKQTYVYLHSANYNARHGNLAAAIYGGGYYSIVENTKVDAKSGCTDIIYGGSYGTSAVNLNTNALKEISFNSTNTVVNLYDGMDNSNMMVFGGGGYAGSTTTNVNLYGGTAENVYGGSYNEGYCQTTHVNVPAWQEQDDEGNLVDKSSTASVKAIFGGGYGNDVTLPCDEDVTNVTFSSATAYVTDGVIYGGNNAKRAAKTTNVTINVPAKKNATEYISVCGAGNGASTIAGYTNVTLESGAQVNNVYGGGRDGKVYAYYKNIGTGARTYYDKDETYVEDPASDNPRHGYAAWKWTSTDDGNNTKITIKQGATAQTVYGAGYGSDATVAGSTSVYNLGGTVTSNIYGGGYSGNVLYQQAEEKAGTTDDTVLATISGDYDDQKNNIYTSIYHNGGTVDNIYGGGYNGNVGSQHDVTNYPADTRVYIGVADKTSFYDGCPIVLRSVYGGGYKGAILGTANINMYNGYIGYNYDTATSKYTENLKATADDTHNLLKESGNIFGGGYGEGATTDHTVVTMYDGTIRNSLYGGGEIASVGVAEISSIYTDDRKKIPNITVAGSTEVNMYGGLVSANVFGGGRGYAIDDAGNTQTGEKQYSDGYTFGKTNVNIYRGTVGTVATLEDGAGNVFGGGNIGYVYGANESSSVTKSGKTYKNVTKGSDGYYYISSDGTGDMSEDCKVEIKPVCKALVAGDVNSKSYTKGQIVPHEDLDAITSSTDWSSPVFGDLDKQGVIIRNAVFAGGNVSAGSDKVYANTNTVYGNATASVIDCFAKDLITLGDDGVGGLYGDGNLTFVDGYRELNITNYGTDYYQLDAEKTLEEYQNLNDRERSYFELKYVNNSDATKTITGEAYDKLSDEDKKNWTAKGFCTLYAGRMMNTIQRADFCGVFGSRIVLKGAQDRVPSEMDYTNYSINRIGELSLNQKTQSSKTNGNYFGIYNVVNYLGALASDVKFSDPRTTTNTSHLADGTTSYYSFKSGNLDKKYRNDATSQNKIALASGVWLELVKQKATGNKYSSAAEYNTAKGTSLTDAEFAALSETEKIPDTDKDVYNIYSYAEGEKIYGPITGVVELDLINAAKGEGGGYVYALNQHGTLKQDNAGSQTTLTDSNSGAVSYKQYTYNDMSATTKIETSGNFVSAVKNIVDDCYPYNKTWLTSVSPTSKAHYWYIKSDYYVYDRYISAYTGATMAYKEEVSGPLAITAQAGGKMKLINVQENLNAYWEDDDYASLDDKYKLTGDNTCIVINGNTYHKNTPISYWDWAHLTDDLRGFFTTNTYVCNVAVGSYTQGQVLTKEDYDSAKNSTELKGKYLVESDVETKVDNKDVVYKAGTLISSTVYDNLSNTQKGQCISTADCFNVTNAVTADNGFLLTFDWNNPDVWGDYYIKESAHTSDDMLRTSTASSDYPVLSPSYHCTSTDSKNIYGQSSYNAGDVVDETTYNSEPSEADRSGITGLAEQAAFEHAYVAMQNCEFTVTGDTKSSYYVKGAAISATLYGKLTDAQKLYFEAAYTCTTTYQLSDDKYYINGDLITATEWSNTIPSADQTTCFSPAYICTTSGDWGGKLYSSGKNYPALEVCSLPDDQRSNFVYNIDAFETLLANSTSQTTDVTNYVTSATYQGTNGSNIDNYATRHTGLYANETAIDFTATYTGDNTLNLKESVNVIGKSAQNSLSNGDALTNTEYDKLTNEKVHYSEFTKEEGTDTYYFVTSDFWIGDTWHAPGSTITSTEYDALTPANKAKVYTFDTSGLSLTSGNKYYFCKEDYTDTKKTDVTLVSGTLATQTSVIDATAFATLVNEQTDFEISGAVPSETSSLYVNCHVPITDLNEEKIVTVIYDYSYTESNDAGTAYETTTERHVVNVHIQFESGRPTVGELLTPPAVLPGSVVGLNQPSVSKGAYEILGGGWEMYTDRNNAENHTNALEYTNNNTKMYWYQNEYYVAYYAKSYLGKAYSNVVPITVANYHRMSEVMAKSDAGVVGDSDGDGKADYMYLNTLGKRDAKVYIKDAAELDELASFFTLTKDGGSGFENITKCANLDFIVDGDIDHSPTYYTYDEYKALDGHSGITEEDFNALDPISKIKTAWTSIGNTTDGCFSGNFHGDGHTISGLTNSLFGSLCGNVYNTGVTGSFTGSGITDAGDGNVYNCWVATTGSVDGDTKVTPILGGTGTTTNSYFYSNNNIYGTREGTFKKPLSAFLDGEVAYNLNSYYLNRRYYDNAGTSEGIESTYWKLASDGTNAYNRVEKYYPAGYTNNYVETRYGNEDFIYADGTIPLNTNFRKYSVDEKYYPVYPDDYIFFGQKLTYGLISQNAADKHVEHPEAVNRVTNADDESKNTKLLVTDAATSNRVYRAPAYYKSKNMESAYFNKQVAFAGTYTPSTGNIYDAATDATDLLYKNMTAVDFTGYNDVYNSEQNAFGKPFLDYEGLTKYTTSGLTQNLLVYADPTYDKSSYDVLDAALPEVETSWGSYRTLAVANGESVKGHLVDKTTSGYVATRDHFLVDEQFFNCPISYQFDSSHYMWYQRTPDNYVGVNADKKTTGWEAISLPFTAETVTTQTKGEITHFYKGTNGYSGHEYWLNEFAGEGTKPENPAANTFYAAFSYPEANTDPDAEDKTDSNTFLWDYYYSHDDGDENDAIDKDAHGDDYQNYDNGLYYNDTRTYEDYPLYTAAVPYIIGFPGKRYHEFDLSGEFVPANRYKDIAAVPAQTISFMSVSEAAIGVSDDESAVTADGYSYVPNYLDTELTAGSDYTLYSDGSAFTPAVTDETAVPFRPYFKAAPSGDAKSRAAGTIDSIVITSVNPDKGIEDKDELTGELNVYAKKGVIVVESGMTKETFVTIHTVGGALLKAFYISPGEKIETSVPGNVIYVVNKKKLFVR